MSDVNYTFAAIVEQEDVDETWVPKIVDKAGTVAWTAADGEVTGFVASGMTVYRGQIDSRHRLLHVDDVDIKVFVSRARLVAVCRKYDKGGGWIGGLGGMIVLNSISKARAAVRSHGKFLVGQMRWPWLTDVGYAQKTGWSSANKLRLVAQDGSSGQVIYVDLQLPKKANARQLADAILHTAMRHRARCDHIDDDDRQTLASLGLPPYDPAAKRLAMVNVPGAKKALASTAFLGASDTCPPNATAALAQTATPSAALEVRAAATVAPRAAEPPDVDESRAASAPPPAAPRATEAPDVAMEPHDVDGSPAASAPPPAARRATEPPDVDEPRATSAPPPTCGSCGSGLAPGARFCRRCGAAIEAAASAPPVAAFPPCASCEAPLPSGARFCRRCGTPVDLSMATSATGVGDLTATREDEPAPTATTIPGVRASTPEHAATALIAAPAQPRIASPPKPQPAPLPRAAAPHASPPSRPTGGRFTLIATLGVLVVAAGVAGGYFLVGNRQSASTQPRTRAAAGTGRTAAVTETAPASTAVDSVPGAASATTDAATDTTGSAASAAGDSSGASADDSSGASADASQATAPLLAGTVIGDGFTIRPPAGWSRDSDEVDKGGFVESRWHLPGSPGVHFLIDHTNGYTASARTGAEAVRAAVRRAPSYRELAWQADTPEGWRWSFSVQGNRSIDRFRSACGNGYAMLGHAPTATYPQYRGLFDAVTRSVQFTC